MNLTDMTDEELAQVEQMGKLIDMTTTRWRKDLSNHSQDCISDDDLGRLRNTLVSVMVQCFEPAGDTNEQAESTDTP